MRAIFISYRRDDAEGEAGRLFADLSAQFGKGSVFMDVTGIAPGRDFRTVVDKSIGSCGVLLALIGKRWIDAKDHAGRRRLDDPSDFVRLETATALRRDIPVVPVLVHGASMPKPEQLPEDIRDLVYRNGVELTHVRWASDVQVLAEAIRPDLLLEESAKATDHAVRGPSPAEVPRAVSAAPRATRSLPWKRVAVSVAVVGIAAGGLATYEYRKGQEIAALEAAAKEAAAKEAAAREEAARQAAAREAAVKEAAAQETAAREAVARASATEAATREAAARQAAAREAASRQAAARAASQARVASAAPPKNSVAFAEPLSEANAALKASGKTPGDQYLASTSPWAKTLAQQALDSGFLSRLPPNVSAVFGLARPPEGTDVRQLVSKGADEVRTFNVNVANHADIVIFNVNAQSRATKAYLITPDGQLRRAVAYQPGGQSRELSDADGKAGLAREKEFWSARAK